MEILALRRKTGLSQRKFADLFDIPVRTLQQWEQGKSSPPHYLVSMMKAILAKKKTPAQRPLPQQYAIPPKSQWKVCISDPFDNCERIYPIQQRKVRSLINDISQNPAVKSITVFGSSITEKCHMGSDVDLYVEMTDDGNPTTETHDFPFDLWTSYSADKRLKDEIAAKGVRVYDSSSNTF